MNPRLPLLAVLASAVLATPVAAAECATGPLAGQAQDVETIQRLEKAWLAAELRGETEVLEALMALGYRADEARSALKAASKTFKKDAGVKEKLAAALKHLGPALHTS